MRVIATPVLVSDIKPGDLISFHPPSYWETCVRLASPSWWSEEVFLALQPPDPRENGMARPYVHGRQLYRLTIDTTPADPIGGELL